MKVRLCEGCTYTPGDIADYYDSRAEHTLCAHCPTKPLPMAPKYKRERRRWTRKEGRHVAMEARP